MIPLFCEWKVEVEEDEEYTWLQFGDVWGDDDVVDVVSSRKTSHPTQLLFRINIYIEEVQTNGANNRAQDHSAFRNCVIDDTAEF
jgi:hypothetical protein